MGADLYTVKITFEMFLQFSKLKCKRKNFFEAWLESGPLLGNGPTTKSQTNLINGSIVT